MTQQKERYLNLNGLRAYSAIAIVIMHVYANMGFKYEGLLDSIICSFAELTLLFFIISSFSLCCGYYDKFKSGNIDIDKFYSRRFSRILPFFALMTAIDLIASPSWNSLLEGLTNVSMVFGLLPNPDIKVIGVGWFVGVIFVFYLVFPFFVYLIGSKKKVLVSIAVSVAFFLITCNYWMTDSYLLTPIGKHNIVYSAPFFLAGGGIFVYRDLLSEFVKNNMLLSYIIVFVISCVFFAVPKEISLFDTYRIGFVDTTYEFTKDCILNFSVLYMLPIQALWIVLAIGPNIYFFTNKIASFVSSISMEIYLCHMAAFRVIEKVQLSKFVSSQEIEFWLTAFISLGVAVLFSYIMKFKVFPMFGKLLSSRIK